MRRLPGVQVAGGFVGEHHIGSGDQRPGDRDALLLPAGQLGRSVREAVGEAEGLHELAQVPGRVCARRG